MNAYRRRRGGRGVNQGCSSGGGCEKGGCLSLLSSAFRGGGVHKLVRKGKGEKGKIPPAHWVVLPSNMQFNLTRYLSTYLLHYYLNYALLIAVHIMFHLLFFQVQLFAKTK